MPKRSVRWAIAALILFICAFLALQVLTIQVGMHRYRIKDFDGAMPWLRAAMVFNPFTSSVRNAVATILVHKGRLDDAERVVQRNLKRSPEDPRSHNIEGLILEKRGRFDQALEEYKTAVRLDPGLPEGYMNLGFLLARMGRMDEAGKALDRAVELAPQFKEDRDRIMGMRPALTPEPFTGSAGE